MASWKVQKNWSDKFIPQIIREIADLLIGVPEVVEDQRRNTDLILSTNHKRIACRVRRHAYLEQGMNEFTIRTRTKYGQKTEIHKIQEGWGDYMFYSFCNPEETEIVYYNVIDLHVFREFLLKISKLPYERMNSDGTGYRVFSLERLKLFNPNSVVKSYPKVGDSARVGSLY